MSGIADDVNCRSTLTWKKTPTYVFHTPVRTVVIRAAVNPRIATRVYETFYENVPNKLFVHMTRI